MAGGALGIALPTAGVLARWSGGVTRLFTDLARGSLTPLFEDLAPAFDGEGGRTGGLHGPPASAPW